MVLPSVYPYAEPPPCRDFGLAQPGGAGAGGLAMDTHSNLIPQHNLEAVWQRVVRPRSDILPRHLAHPSLLDGMFSRPPGAMRFEARPETMRGRNLLAVEGEGKELTVWMVNERSDRKTLERVECVWDGEGLREEKRAQVEQTVEASDELVWSGGLWRRTRRGLYWREGGEEREVKVLDGAVCGWNWNGDMDEVAVADANGRVWTGQIGRMGSVKNVERVEYVSWTDHPRVLWSAGGDECAVSLLDVRSAESSVVWRAERRDSRHALEPRPIPDTSTLPPPRLHCVERVGDGRYCLAVTDRDAVLLDVRQPGVPVLSLPHGMTAVDVVRMGPPATLDGGCAVAVYGLSHVVAESAHWALFVHHSGFVSSVGPWRRQQQPTDRERMCGGVWSREGEERWRSSLPRETRAVGVARVEEEVDCVVRMMDDGSLWYDVMRWGEERSRQERNTAVEESERGEGAGWRGEVEQEGVELEECDLDPDDDEWMGEEKEVRLERRRRTPREELEQEQTEHDLADLPLSSIAHKMWTMSVCDK